MFEILRRDGMARIGVLETRNGMLETPALLPVINPKLNTVTPQELYHEFGFRGLITNSYIIRNNDDLRQRAQTEGLHKMLEFPGIIMTDSGTFQSHMYGEVEVSNEEIIEFQKSIGTDIGTVPLSFNILFLYALSFHRNFCRSSLSFLAVYRPLPNVSPLSEVFCD